MENTGFYTFYREEDEKDNSIHYVFTTERELIYSVFFNPSHFSTYLEDLPHLSKYGHLFGFFPLNEEPQETTGKRQKKHDAQIANTICRIIEDFIEKKGKESVLLFHCDSDDERQKCRFKLFDNWYKKKGKESGIFKDGLEVELNMPDGIIKTEFLGFVVHSQEKGRVEVIKSEFEEIAVTLVQQKRA